MAAIARFVSFDTLCLIGMCVFALMCLSVYVSRRSDIG